MRELRAKIAGSARRNFILERELGELDEKIKLLIKNRITVQEVLAQTSGLKKEEEGASEEKGGPLKGKLHLYEEMCYLLQSKPKYFAKLARVISAKDIPMFVQTVVFDMYGDQYDTREERLLLTLFRIVLKDELDQSTDKGSLLRANTAITQVLLPTFVVG
jgi:Ras GTPase-activating-like protein IQGAP2/3